MNMLQADKAGDVSLESIDVIALASDESPDVWYRRGTWTEVSATRTITINANADGYVLIKGVLVNVGVGGTYTVTETYSYMSCKGWTGRC